MRSSLAVVAVAFVLALPVRVLAQGGQPYTTFTSFDQLLGARDARYRPVTRVSDPGSREHPAYTGFFFYQVDQFDVSGRYLLGFKVYCPSRDVRAAGQIGI